MNNLNTSCSLEKKTAPVPDILSNLNVGGCGKDKHANKDVNEDVTEKKLLNVGESSHSEQTDLSDYTQERESQRRKSRKLKKALGYAGWVLCFPLMLASIVIRDKPSRDDPDEWKDDPCLPWWYDVDFRYPGEEID